MRVMLLKDVYKLGRAGDVKRVADGYGRNYLVPQGLAVLATEGVLKQADRIRQKASEERSRLNQELGAVAEQLDGLRLVFAAKAGETGKLYGSITPAMILEAIQAEKGLTIDRRQVDTQPIKTLGLHTVDVRLTIDLVPQIAVLVHREGESPESVLETPEEVTLEDGEIVGTFADLQAELEAVETAEEAGEEYPPESEPEGLELTEEAVASEDEAATDLEGAQADEG